MEEARQLQRERFALRKYGKDGLILGDWVKHVTSKPKKFIFGAGRKAQGVRGGHPEASRKTRSSTPTGQPPGQVFDKLTDDGEGARAGMRSKRRRARRSRPKPPRRRARASCPRFPASSCATAPRVSTLRTTSGSTPKPRSERRRGRRWRVELAGSAAGELRGDDATRDFRLRQAPQAPGGCVGEARRRHQGSREVRQARGDQDGDGEGLRDCVRPRSTQSPRR